MIELDRVSAHHPDAQGAHGTHSTRNAGFTRCPRQVLLVSATKERRSDGPLDRIGFEPRSTTPPPVKRHARPSLVRSLAAVGALAAAVIIAGIRWPHLGDSFALEMRRLNGVWVVPAMALAGVSMTSAALQQRRVLRATGMSLPVRSMMALTFASNAVSVTLPLAGSSAGTAFTYVQLKKRGADVATAAWVLATSGIISTAILAIVLGVGAAATGDGETSIVGAVAMLLGIVPILVLLLSIRSPMVRRHVEQIAQRTIDRVHRLKRGSGEPDEFAVTRAFQRLAGFRLGWRAGAMSSMYSAVNWITDMACLAVCVTALGVPVPWTHLVIIYGATLGAASLSFTPAGIGLVESAIALLLVQSGVPASAAIVAAVLYRAVSCWLVLAIGWISYATTRRAEVDTAPVGWSAGVC